MHNNERKNGIGGEREMGDYCPGKKYFENLTLFQSFFEKVCKKKSY
jgi:hypothetical protein